MRYDGQYPVTPQQGVIQSPSGDVGSSEIVVDGFEAGFDPGDNYLYGNDWYILLHAASKLYRVIRASAADAYGRATFKIEPPLLQAQNNVSVLFDSSYQFPPNNRTNYIPMQVFIEDDSFEVNVDGAGLYRCKIKFTEAMI
jgi:hypothetical protein